MRRPRWMVVWSDGWIAVLSGAVLLFLIFPVAVVLPLSFSGTKGLEFPPPSFGVRRYAEFFASREWTSAMVLSVRVALLSTGLSVPLGVALALGLVRGRFRGKGVLNGLLMAPLIVPSIIYALALFFFYRQIGLFDSQVGLALAYTVLSIPYV